MKNKIKCKVGTHRHFPGKYAMHAGYPRTDFLLVLRIQHPNLPSIILTIFFSDGDSAIISYSAKSTASSAVPGPHNTIPEQQDTKL